MEDGPFAPAPGAPSRGTPQAPFDPGLDDPFDPQAGGATADPFAEGDDMDTQRLERLEATPLPLPPAPRVTQEQVITSARPTPGSDDWPLARELELRSPEPVGTPAWIPWLTAGLGVIVGLLLGALIF